MKSAPQRAGARWLRLMLVVLLSALALSCGIAASDNYSTPHNTPLVVPAPGVLVNDISTTNPPTPLTALYVSGPSNGTLQCQSNPALKLCPDGSFTYTPNAGFTGADTFLYEAADSEGAGPDATVTILVGTGVATAGQLIISEFRLSGPGGDNDEFIEIYNTGDAPFTVVTSDGSAGYAVASSEGTIRFTIPVGTVIPARGHYLGVNSVGYSLTSYPADSDSNAAGDITYTADIPLNSGIALLNTANTGNFALATLLDAVGPTTEANTLYREGVGYPPLITTAANYSIVRDLRSGLPRDTNDNDADFDIVDVSGTALCTSTANFQCLRHGEPGPENLSSPIQRNAVVKASLVDAQCSGMIVNPTLPSGCRFERNTSGAIPGAPLGTISIRRRFTNTTQQPISRLRFRIVDTTTTPEAVGNNGTADLRALTSSNVTVTCQNETGTPHLCSDNAAATTTIEGVSLEGTSAIGGGFNSSLSVGSVTVTPLQPGESLNMQFTLGVVQNGRFRFFVNVEALTDTLPPPAATKSGSMKGTGRRKLK